MKAREQCSAAFLSYISFLWSVLSEAAFCLLAVPYKVGVRGLTPLFYFGFLVKKLTIFVVYAKIHSLLSLACQ